jgi:membrane protein required for colicin V production
VPRGERKVRVVNQVDVVLLVLLVPFAIRGWWRGFFRETLALAGLVGGVLAASAGGTAVAAEVAAVTRLSPLAARIVAIVGLFLAVYLAAYLAGLVAERLARAVALGGLNRAAGLAFGVAKGGVLLGVGLSLVQQLAPSRQLDALVDGSRVGRPLTRLAQHVVAAGRALAPAVPAHAEARR